jgi:glycine/D-amino acid oxidase-like deaminating enzyme
LLGGYEPEPMAVDPAASGTGFQVTDLPLDLGVVRRLADSVREIFPALAGAPVRELRGGLPTMTADDRPIVGPVPGLAGFYAIAGCCVGGLSAAPGLGQLLAERIVHGVSSLPLDGLAIDRFGPELDDDDALREAGLRAYANHYAIGG